MTAAAQRMIGSTRSENGTGTVRVEDRYPTTIDDLWSALTEPAPLARWIAEIDGEAPGLGGEVAARFTSGWAGPVRVQECEPPRRLVLSLDPDTPDRTVVTAELTPDGSATRLVIEESGLPLPNVALHGAGWQAHVEDLAAHLAGAAPTDRARWHARWQELIPGYRAAAPAAPGPE